MNAFEDNKILKILHEFFDHTMTYKGVTQVFPNATYFPEGISGRKVAKLFEDIIEILEGLNEPFEKWLEENMEKIKEIHNYSGEPLEFDDCYEEKRIVIDYNELKEYIKGKRLVNEEDLNKLIKRLEYEYYMNDQTDCPTYWTYRNELKEIKDKYEGRE